jgi:hypothetical protein
VVGRRQRLVAHEDGPRPVGRAHEHLGGDVRIAAAGPGGHALETEPLRAQRRRGREGEHGDSDDRPLHGVTYSPLEARVSRYWGFGSSPTPAPLWSSVGVAVSADGWLHVLQQRLDEVDREREDDRRGLLAAGDLTQRLQVAQLQRGGRS